MVVITSAEAVMSQSHQRALGSLVVWGPVLAIFAGLFFLVRGGAASFGEDPPRIAAVAGLFAVGFLLHFAILFRTRSRGAASRDERDLQVERRAWGPTLGLSLGYVFLTCIVLWEAHRDTGLVPVGWMWFIAYSTVFLAFVIQAGATLFLERRLDAGA
jgi:hypothetical protein